MEFGTWSPEPLEPGASSSLPDELLVTFDEARAHRVLIFPALFDEANKLRRFTLSFMRALDEAGIDSALPDLPGCNESLAPLAAQTISDWQRCAEQAAQRFQATHCLAIRGGALLAPSDRPGWRYGLLDGPKLLSGLLRAQTIAAREAGLNETRETLIERGRERGLTLGGWTLGASLLKELETATLTPSPQIEEIEQAQLDGGGLWLRAEPGEDPQQAATLAHIIAKGCGVKDEEAR